MLGMVALDRRQWAQSAVLLALAVTVKSLWPALAAFLLLGRLARQHRLRRGAGVFCLTIALCWLPFILLATTGGGGESAEGWPSWVPGAVRRAIEAPRQFLEHPNFNATVYQFLAEQFHPESHAPKLIALAVVLAGTALLIWRRRW